MDEETSHSQHLAVVAETMRHLRTLQRVSAAEPRYPDVEQLPTMRSPQERAAGCRRGGGCVPEGRGVPFLSNRVSAQGLRQRFRYEAIIVIPLSATIDATALSVSRQGTAVAVNDVTHWSRRLRWPSRIVSCGGSSQLKRRLVDLS